MMANTNVSALISASSKLVQAATGPMFNEVEGIDAIGSQSDSHNRVTKAGR